MATVEQLLAKINEQKNNLADNINTMGVPAQRNEKLNTLVPKVLQISAGGEGIKKLPLPQPIEKIYNGSYQNVAVEDFGYTSEQAEMVYCAYIKINDSYNYYSTAYSCRDVSSNMLFLIRPKYGYAWVDNTYDVKPVRWSMVKAPANLAADAYSVTLDGENCVAVINLSYDSNASPVMDKSQIPCRATMESVSFALEALLKNKKLYITGYWNWQDCDDFDITVTLPENSSYLSDTITINVSCGNEPFKHICGATWSGTSYSDWYRTDDSVGLPAPVPYMLNSVNYSSPFDHIYPWNEMQVTERSGGTMVSIPKFWYKLGRPENSSYGLSIRIADYPAEGFCVSPAHMDRGDGKGERDVVYVGRYHCDNTYFKSTSGIKAKDSMSLADFRSNISSRIPEFRSTVFVMDFTMRFTIWLLYLVEFADWNSQAMIGYGCGGVTLNGTSDNMPYHTGTMKSSRTSSDPGISYRYIEGLWGNVFDIAEGCFYDANGMNLILNPNDFGDNSKAVLIGKPSHGQPSAFNLSNAIGYPMFYPCSNGGSTSTYSCDTWYYYSNKPTVYWGGGSGSGYDRGLFCAMACVNYDGGVGTRIMELP